LREGFSLDDHLREIESSLVMRALTQADGDRLAAARLLGITPRSLRYLIGKHQLEMPLEATRIGR
jgi:transcriptional regulator with GAF, ATPase, and Fis domain